MEAKRIKKECDIMENSASECSSDVFMDLETIDASQSQKVDGETLVEQVFRLFGRTFIHEACNMTPRACHLDRTDLNFVACPDFSVVKSCRLVSKTWNATVNEIFRAEGKSLLVVDPGRKIMKSQLSPEAVLKKIKDVLVRPDCLSPEVSSLQFPSVSLYLPPELFRGDTEGELAFTLLPKFAHQIRELNVNFAVDSKFMYLWDSVPFPNMKKITFVGSKESRPSGATIWVRNQHFEKRQHMHLLHFFLQNSPVVEELSVEGYLPAYVPAVYKLPLPPTLKLLDLPLVPVNPDEGYHHLRSDSERILEELTLRASRTIYDSRVVDTSFCENLLKFFGASLTKLTLGVCGDALLDHVIPQLTSRLSVMDVDFSTPLPSLQYLQINAAPWKICNLNSMASQLPVLQALSLHYIAQIGQIRELIELTSTTITHLDLSFSTSLPVEVIRCVQKNFISLRSLKVVGEIEEPGIRECFYACPSLTHLDIGIKNGSSGASHNSLRFGVTGVPADEFKNVEDGEMTVDDALLLFPEPNCLRSRTDLEDLRLTLSSNFPINALMMFRMTFLRMANLRSLTLNRSSFHLTEREKDRIRESNVFGIKINWI